MFATFGDAVVFQKLIRKARGKGSRVWPETILPANVVIIIKGRQSLTLPTEIMPSGQDWTEKSDGKKTSSSRKYNQSLSTLTMTGLHVGFMLKFVVLCGSIGPEVGGCLQFQRYY